MSRAERGVLDRLANELSIASMEDKDRLKILMAEEIERRLRACGIVDGAIIQYGRDAPGRLSDRRFTVLSTTVTWHGREPRIELNVPGHLYDPMVVLKYAKVVE